MASQIISQFEAENSEGLCFYHIVTDSSKLKEHEKAMHYHINPNKLKHFKSLLG